MYLSGRRIYLGKYGTKAARKNYDRVVAEWLAAGRTYSVDRETTVNDVLLAYLRHAKSYYVKNGQQTNEVVQVKNCIKHVKALYGSAYAECFGPLALEAVRDRMIEHGWCRKHINKQVGRVVRIFKWAASKQLVAPDIYEALRTVEGLKKERTVATDYAPVGPVAVLCVTTFLTFLSEFSALAATGGFGRIASYTSPDVRALRSA